MGMKLLKQNDRQSEMTAGHCTLLTDAKRDYGVVAGGVGSGVGMVLVVGRGKMNWLPLGTNIVWTPGASFKMYWYCKISGFC